MGRKYSHIASWPAWHLCINFGVLIGNQKYSLKELCGFILKVLVEWLSSVASHYQLILKLQKLLVPCLSKLINLPEKKMIDWTWNALWSFIPIVNSSVRSIKIVRVCFSPWCIHPPLLLTKGGKLDLWWDTERNYSRWLLAHRTIREMHSQEAVGQRTTKCICCLHSISSLVLMGSIILACSPSDIPYLWKGTPVMEAKDPDTWKGKWID